jgi:hypothetical protein
MVGIADDASQDDPLVDVSLPKPIICAEPTKFMSMIAWTATRVSLVSVKTNRLKLSLLWINL